MNEKAAWSWFCPWYQNYLMSEQNNPVDSLKEVYTSDYCITLDELPDLKTYPISGSTDPKPTSPKPTETTAPAKPTETTAPADPAGKLGDVNGDGTADIMDVMALNKFLLGVTELDTDAQKRADTDANDKLDSEDSLNLLKYVLEIIKELPVK